jgi:hypothetical protein
MPGACNTLLTPPTPPPLPTHAPPNPPTPHLLNPPPTYPPTQGYTQEGLLKKLTPCDVAPDQ